MPVKLKKVTESKVQTVGLAGQDVGELELLGRGLGFGRGKHVKNGVLRKLII